MQINLRFGMHRDTQLIHEQKHNIDGLVVPAHILVYQAGVTSVFVASMYDKPYVLDPMTFVFQNKKGNLFNSGGRLRASINRLCEECFPELADLIESLGPVETLAPEAVADVPSLCKGFVEFQLTAVARSFASSKASKYLSRYSTTAATAPRCVLPPYFRFAAVRDAWYAVSLQCAQAAQSLFPDQAVAPVVCCPVSALGTPAIELLAEDYASFPRVFIWLDNLNEATASSTDIGQCRQLVGSLSDAGPVPEALYGGYMLMLTGHDGLDALSHGIIYTQHKSYSLTPGTGGAPERYYIPKLHQFRSLSQTDLILHQHPELICDCSTCSRVLGDSPDNIVYYLDNPEMLRTHFMTVRREEADGLSGRSLADIGDELRATHAAYHPTISALPNPDAFVSRKPMRGLDYLLEWADAFS